MRRDHQVRPVPRRCNYCMDVCASRQNHAVRVLTHIKKPDDCFGQFLVRVICDCRAVREIEPEALARLVGWKVTLKELAPRMRCDVTATYQNAFLQLNAIKAPKHRNGVDEREQPDTDE